VYTDPVLRIGDLSALSQVSIKALRHYDALGLLKPARVDDATGYRYYSAAQLPRIYRLLALKDLGFPLDQIGALLEEGITIEQLRGMLRLRRAEQQDHVRDEQERLARIDARLMLIEKEERMTTDVVIKEISPQWIASVRDVIPSYPDVGRLYPEVYAGLVSQAAGGIAVALWHDNEYKERDVDAEAGVYIEGSMSPGGRVRVYELPGPDRGLFCAPRCLQSAHRSVRRGPALARGERVSRRWAVP
jgi:DNA-binding transcriptional MerR regulator